MKKFIKSLLLKAKIYEYIKYSSIFSIYALFFKRQVIIDQRKEIQFYNSFLSNCDLIFDIGANDGHKTEAFLKISKKVISCEPDPKNFQTLEIRFRNKKNIVIPLNKALAASPGIKTMFLHHPGSAFNTLNEKFKSITEADNLEKWNEKIKYGHVISVETTTLDELIKTYGKPDFIKIDVEGYELEVIKGLSVSIDFLSIECLFPDFEKEFYEILDRLYEIHKNLKFNVAINESLILKEFIRKEELKKYLNTFKENHFELIVKMQ